MAVTVFNSLTFVRQYWKAWLYLCSISNTEYAIPFPRVL